MLCLVNTAFLLCFHFETGSYSTAQDSLKLYSAGWPQNLQQFTALASKGWDHRHEPLTQLLYLQHVSVQTHLCRSSWAAYSAAQQNSVASISSSVLHCLMTYQSLLVDHIKVGFTSVSAGIPPDQWFSTFVMLWPINTVPHAVVTPTKIYFCCYFITAILLLLWIII